MPAKPRTKAKAVVLQPGMCPTCGHLLVHVVTEAGTLLTLDTTHPAVWVLSGREQDGTPVAVPSRGYLEHVDHLAHDLEALSRQVFPSAEATAFSQGLAQDEVEGFLAKAREQGMIPKEGKPYGDN